MSSSAEGRARPRTVAGRLLLALLLAAGLARAAGAAAPDAYPGIGRAATAQELAAWDIDVRPDFKGLPPGSGTVPQGMVIWEAQCASCHGVFGESNEVFNPLVGGTTADDVQRGRVATLANGGYPGRTTLMKLSSVASLWDYIRRAMPWNAPKSLSVNEVYAVTAYLLNLGGVLPENFTLSNTTMADAQARLPNRDGMRTDHGLWPGKGLGNGGVPDVRVTACMHDCAAPSTVRSELPAFARNSHGNLAAQNRSVGAQRGADTVSTHAPGSPSGAAAPVAAPLPTASAAPTALLQQHLCTACHGMDQKSLLGPGFAAVARKYADQPDREAVLAARIRSGGGGAWGAVTMPPQTLPEADLQRIARWLADGASR